MKRVESRNNFLFARLNPRLDIVPPYMLV